MISKKKNKIGDFFIKRKLMTHEQVIQVLELQKYHLDEKFGEIALLLNYIDNDAINQYLSYKEL